MATKEPAMVGAVSTDSIIEVRVSLTGEIAIGAGSWLRAGTEAIDTSIGERCFVGFRSLVQFADIADGSMLASRVNLKGTPEQRIRVGRNVWLGTNVMVCPGIAVGDGAVVAAGALVTEDVPEDTIVVGRPARILKKRNVIEDGVQDPRPIIDRVRNRATNGLPSFLNEASLSPERTLRDNGFTTWRIGENTLADAELDGGPEVSIGKSCILMGRSTATGGICADGGIYLANKVRIGDAVIMEGAGGLVVGSECTVGTGVTIVTSTHHHGRRSLPWEAAPVSLESGAVIGRGAVIVGPVTIGVGAVVEPYSVVIRDVQAGERTRGVVSLKSSS